MAFARRPHLEIEEDREGVQSRVEGDGLPYVRLLVSNPRRRRAAHGARVVLEHHREQRTGAEAIPTGLPQLGWTTVPEERHDSTVIFAGASRPVDIGRLVRGPSSGGLVFGSDDDERRVDAWALELALSGLKPTDERHRLPWRKDGYVVCLLVGDDDGAARRYDVDIDWDGDATTPQDALDSVEMAVREVRT
jgi:hypothetical protein